MQETERYRLAEVYLEAGDPLEALRLLEPLVEELRTRAGGLLTLGRAYYRSAQLGRAQNVFEKPARGPQASVIRQVPAVLSGPLRASQTHSQEAFERVVQMAPTDAYARLALGRTLQRRSRHDEAKVHFRIAAALDPAPEFRELVS